MRRHMKFSIRGMQKFYTKIEDRPEVREVVTTFKEHHPIEKVSHPTMRSGEWAMHVEPSIQGHLTHAAVSCATALRLAGRFPGTSG